MAIRFYDNAVLNKIKDWVRDPHMYIMGVNESTRLFQMIAEQNDDKPLSLPLIVLSRNPEMQVLVTQKKAMTYDSAHVRFDKNHSALLNAIPIQLNYQLDIYTRTFAEADEYTREFIFNFINDPKIRIELPYNNQKVAHDSNIKVESTVSDNSDIPERLIKGQFTRMTIRLLIDDAYLFSIPFMDNWNIEDLNDIIVEE